MSSGKNGGFGMTNRELDALVAEKVMHDTSNRCPKCHGLKETDVSDSDNWIDMRPCRHCDARGWIPPACSTDIAAAFQVVEKMREKGFSHTVTSNLMGEHISLFLEVNKSKHVQSEICVTAPEAICHAALRALGEEV